MSTIYADAEDGDEYVSDVSHIKYSKPIDVDHVMETLAEDIFNDDQPYQAWSRQHDSTKIVYRNRARRYVNTIRYLDKQYELD